MKMFCCSCGQPLAEDAQFCIRCGRPIGLAIASSPTQSSSMAGTAAAPVIPIASHPVATSPTAVQPTKSNKKRWIIGGVVAFLIFVALIASNPDKKEEHEPTLDSTASAVPTKGFQLTAKQTNLLNRMLQDDARGFGEGGDSLLSTSMTRVSAQDVAKTYEENEAAGDQKYYKKQLVVDGVVDAINSGLGNEPYVLFRSPNMFQHPQAQFGSSVLASLTSSPTNPSETELRIAGLKKGQRIVLVCNGGGSVAGTPMFNDCVFADTYAQAAVNREKEEIGRVLAGREKGSEQVQKLVVFTLVASKMLSDNSSCLTSVDSAACIKEMNQALSGITHVERKAKVKEIVNELKAKGVDVSGLRE